MRGPMMWSALGLLVLSTVLGGCGAPALPPAAAFDAAGMGAALALAGAALPSAAGVPAPAVQAGTPVPGDPQPDAAAGLAFSPLHVVNVRSGPGTTYDVIGQMQPGQTYQATATNPGRDWLQFAYQGQVAWASAPLTRIQGDPNSLPISQSLPPTPIPSPDRLVAPTIHLDTKVVPVGWHTVKTANGTELEWDVASYAAGWLKNSARPGEVGNMVLSGHHNIEGEVFRYLVDLNVGDPISVFEGGAEFKYRVVEKFILPDKYVSYEQKLDNAKWIGPFPDERLTLITCWPYTNNTHRLIVIAKPER